MASAWEKCMLYVRYLRSTRWIKKYGCKEKARRDEHQAVEDGCIIEEAVKLEADDGCRVALRKASYTSHPLQ
jgi:hypothetical protein